MLNKTDYFFDQQAIVLVSRKKILANKLKKAASIIQLAAIILTLFVVPVSSVKAAPPANTSANTAIDISSFPYTTTQTVDDAGTTYTVWYKFTAPVGATVIGAWAFGDLATYKPTIKPYLGPAGSPTQILGIQSENKPIQFPVTAGQEYFLEIAPNAGNPTPATLTLNVQLAPNDAAQSGDLFVISDDEGHPAPIYSPNADYTVRKFVNFPFDSTASAADNLTDGTMLTVNQTTSELEMRDANFNLITSLPWNTDRAVIRANRNINKFYVQDSAPFVPPVVKVVDADGTVEATTHTITGSSTLRSLVANDAGTEMLYARTSFGADVRKWDLVNDVDLGVIAAGIPNYIVEDMLILPDQTVLISFANLSLTDLQVRHYQFDGTLLNTFNFGSTFMDAVPRIAYSNDWPTAFWVWGHQAGDGAPLSIFKKIQISDGAALVTRTYAEYETGIYAYNPTATPIARFGNTNSCPFLVLTGIAPSTFDLSIAKVADDNTPDEGQTVQYTATVTNNGPAAATGITVSDVLPSQVAYVSDVASQGSYASGVWTVGDLNNGAAATLAITVTVDPGTGGTTFDNTATITAPSDTDLTNNTATASLTVNVPPAPPVSGGGGGGFPAPPPVVTPPPVVVTPPVDPVPAVPPPAITTPANPLPRTGVMLLDLLPWYTSIYAVLWVLKKTWDSIYLADQKFGKIILNFQEVVYPVR